MYKQVEKELSEIKKPEEDRLKKAFERLDVDRDGALRCALVAPKTCDSVISFMNRTLYDFASFVTR